MREVVVAAVVVAFFVALLPFGCMGDHCMGGAIRWYSNTSDPDALSVALVVRQIWRVGSDVVTHSRAAHVNWGDGCTDDYQHSGVLGNYTLFDGTVVEVTEQKLWHTYYQWGAYNAYLQSNTRSLSPANVGGGISKGRWTIVVQENTYYQSPYFSSFGDDISDLFFETPWATFPVVNTLTGPGVSAGTGCFLDSAVNADITPKKQGPPVTPDVVTYEYAGVGYPFVLNSDCSFEWVLPESAELAGVLPFNTHWAFPVILNNPVDVNIPLNNQVTGWFEIPLQLDQLFVGPERRSVKK